MKKHLIHILKLGLFLLSFGVSTQYIRGEQTKSGSIESTFTLIHGGLNRKYSVHIPPSYDKSIPTPVVLNFHGGYGYGPTVERQSGMSLTADRHGFISVYPTAVRGPRFVDKEGRTTGWYYSHWNGGPRADKNKSHNTDDLGFVKKMIDDLEGKFNIDTNRVYATGFSNGGTFVYRLACQLSDKIAAVAPLGTDQLDITCNPLRPIAIFHIHGSDDRYVPFSGGFSKYLPGDYWKPIPKLIDGWRKRNGCVIGNDSRSCNDTGISQITYPGVQCTTYGPYKNNTEVKLCVIEGGDHTWPGNEGIYGGAKTCAPWPDGQTGIPTPPDDYRCDKEATKMETAQCLCAKLYGFFGYRYYAASINDLIWEFLKKHSLIRGN